jgi:hypothetical protein
VIHSDRGTQFTSWAFSEHVRDAGIAPSMGAVGSAFDNAMMESFWGRMQVELLNRRRWKTRIELASAIHDYIELWHTPDDDTPRSGCAPQSRSNTRGPSTTAWSPKRVALGPRQKARLTTRLPLVSRRPRSKPSIPTTIF